MRNSEFTDLYKALPLVLLISLASCQTGGTEKARTDTQEKGIAGPETNFTDSLLQGRSWEEFAKEQRQLQSSPIVTASQLGRMKQFFRDCFRKDRGYPITRTEHVIPWDSITEYLSTDATKDHAIVFHYGLYDPAFHLGWSYRTVDRTANADGYFPMQRVEPYLIYELVNGKVDADPEDDWTRYHQFRAFSSYFAEVEVNRLVYGENRENWIDVKGTDPNCCVLHWEDRLLQMYNHNASLFQGREVLLVVDCTAEWRAVENEDVPTETHWQVKHTLTTHLRLKAPDGTTTDLIDDLPQPAGTGAYYMRGADYGNLCPDRCNAFEKDHVKTH